MAITTVNLHSQPRAQVLDFGRPKTLAHVGKSHQQLHLVSGLLCQDDVGRLGPTQSQQTSEIGRCLAKDTLVAQHPTITAPQYGVCVGWADMCKHII